MVEGADGGFIWLIQKLESGQVMKSSYEKTHCLVTHSLVDFFLSGEQRLNVADESGRSVNFTEKLLWLDILKGSI